MKRMILAFVVLLALASACSGKQELVPAPDGAVTSYVVETEFLFVKPAMRQPNDPTRVKTTHRSDDAWRADSFQDNSSEPTQAAAIQGEVLTIADYRTGDYFHAVAYDEFGGMWKQIGPVEETSVDDFLQKELRRLQNQGRGVYALHHLDDGVIAGRPVKRAELAAADVTHYFAIDAEAMFMLAYSVRLAGGAGVGVQATSIQYNPIISDEDLTLDLSGLKRINAPGPFFTPVP